MSSPAGGQTVGETVIVIEPDNGKDESSVAGDVAEKAKGRLKEDGGFSCCIDVQIDSQRVCRICHLNGKEDEGKTKDLIELGCGCKGELGFSHLGCAEAWFKLKGNRFCEICGETARNVTGAGSRSFMEEWSDSGSSGESGSRGCRERQPLCNFLMGCLVIAFVLPWFFRVNL
nr:E3 ubiquitin-protein ligase MARCH8-like isoform X1 [Ipomoea batatas]